MTAGTSHAIARTRRLLPIVSVCLVLVSTAVGQGTRKSSSQEAVRGVQTYSSANFRLVTALPRSEADELLKRLETMLRLVSGYFGKKNIRTIDKYVARDFDSWPPALLAS